jgi:site-specific recombinase XerD
MSDNTGATMMHSALSEFVQLWLADLTAADRSVNTVRLYGTAVQYFLAWYEDEEHRSLMLDDLTPIALVGYRNHLQHHQAKATSTVNGHVAVLRAWCGWLHEHGHIAINSAARFKFVGRQTAAAPHGLTDRQINALLREAQRTHDPHRDYAILQMLIQTGMRIGECAALNYQDIVFGARSGAVVIRAGKGNKARNVPLNGSARRALAEYTAPLLSVEPTLEAVVAAWPRRQAGSLPSPLWRSIRSNRLSTQSIRRMIDTLVQECAKRKLVPADTSAHTLRHTFAMNYLKENPGDLIGLATQLGHSSLDTTRIYAQPTLEQLAARVDNLSLNAYDG